MSMQTTLAPDVSVPTPAKAFYESKTFWFNLVGGGLEVLQLVADMNILPPGTMTLGLAGGNLLLRWLTTGPMEFVISEKNLTPPPELPTISPLMSSSKSRRRD